MNRNTKPQSGEEGHESIREQAADSTRGGVHVDGYTGPRARMVFNQADSGHGTELSSDEDDSRLGILERTVLASLAILAMLAILVSLLVLPFALAAYFAYSAVSKLFRKEDMSRFVILGTEGSYIVKDLKTREFVAKDIPTMDAARRIHRIFMSHKDGMRQQ